MRIVRALSTFYLAAAIVMPATAGPNTDKSTLARG
jgi:hypothetical protein